MSAHEADQIQVLLSRLMAGVRANGTAGAEITRAEREFFDANPTAPQEDPAAEFRFQEWYLIERESETLGAVPVTCTAMTDDERESLTDSLLGVFQVTAASAAEYTIRDLHDDMIHDLERIEGAELHVDDLLVGRLFVGSLDVFMPSTVLCCQRDAGALAVAIRKDIASLGLDRRLTQAELEHLLFRGRGTAETLTLPDDIPLERLEADLESCLRQGGVDDGSVAELSAALESAVRPGIVLGPLLEQIAFDTDIDIHVVQRLLIQIWQHHHRDGNRAPELSHEPRAAEAEQAPTEDAPRSDPEDPASGLGSGGAKRIQDGFDKHEDMADVFSDIEEMADMDPDPVGFRPDTVNLASDPPAELDTAGSEAAEDENSDGDLRPLITEYLWETGNDAQDVEVLEELFRTQCDASVPRLSVEAMTSFDLLRLALRKFLESAPGQRAASVGRVFAVIEKFYAWVERTQKFELTAVLEAVRVGLIDQAARLEAAGLELSAAAHGTLETSARDLARVVHVTSDWIEVAPDDGDDLVRVEISPAIAQNLGPDDLLLGRLEPGDSGRGSFAGMVIALPPVAVDLLG